MYMVTRWSVAEWLENTNGEITISEILKRCPEAAKEEILCGIEQYFDWLSESKENI